MQKCVFLHPRWFHRSLRNSFGMNGGDDETRTRDLCRDSNRRAYWAWSEGCCATVCATPAVKCSPHLCRGDRRCPLLLNPAKSKLQKLRERLRLMSDEELVKFGKMVRGLTEPR